MSEQIRQWRIYAPSRDAAHRLVQYGFWRQSRTGVEKRFSVLREWQARDQAEAERLKARLAVDMLMTPEMQPAPDEKAQTPSYVIRRKLREVPQDAAMVVGKAVVGLPDPLPSIEASSQAMGIIVPQPFRSGRHFGSYLSDPIYQRLVALAAAAGVTRNRMLEALILAADG
jgi:hypothetical protein